VHVFGIGCERVDWNGEVGRFQLPQGTSDLY